MPYIKKTVKAGDTIEIFKYHTYRWNKKGGQRGKGTGQSSLAMKKNNLRYSENKLRWKINANFQEGDIFLTLTYKRENRPEDVKQAKTELSKFLRKVRRLYKKSGSELKFISTTEQGTKGAVHHHLIMNGEINAREIVRLWEHGRPCIKYLDNSGNYNRLAAYMIKESITYVSTIGYSCSKNLKEPEVQTEIIKKADTWVKNPKTKKGYHIVGEIETGLTESGYTYQHYTMQRSGTTKRSGTESQVGTTTIMMTDKEKSRSDNGYRNEI